MYGPWADADTAAPLTVSRVMVIEPLLGAMYWGPRARLDVFLPGIVTVRDMVMDGGAVAVDPGALVGGLVGLALLPSEGATLLPPPPPHAVTRAMVVAANTRRRGFLINRASAP